MPLIVRLTWLRASGGILLMFGFFGWLYAITSGLDDTIVQARIAVEFAEVGVLGIFLMLLSTILARS